MPTYTIGKGAGKNVQLSHPESSRDHAEIIEDNGNYTLIDHSMNGTMVNGNRVHHSSYPLRRGDTVLFANREMLNWNLIGAPISGGSVSNTSSGANVFAILGFIFAFVVSPLGIIFSAIGLGMSGKYGGRQKGLAIAGLILSIVFTVLWVVWLSAFESFFDAFDTMDSWYYY